MKIGNVARVMDYCARNPRQAFRQLKASSRFPAWSVTSRFTGDQGRPGHESAYADAANPLWEYFQQHHQGRGIHKWTHYFEIYHKHFARFVGRSPHIVEIGVAAGGSLQMWSNYFGAGCRITGIDVAEHCRAFANEHTAIYIADQADRSFWRTFRQEVPPIDILLDDGGHTPEQQRVTLEEMLTHIRPGGVYLCEDIHGAENEFAAYAHSLFTQIHAPDQAQMRSSATGMDADSAPFQELVHSAHIYPFVIVLELNEHPRSGFIAPKHGDF